ncbi:MAG: hypothetical protein ACRDD8_09825 [Bacteroidales bacterium]
MDKVKNFFIDNPKLIIVTLGACLGLYVQHLNNIQKIDMLEAKHKILEQRISDNYKQLDQIKLDKQTFETYTATVSDMKVSILDIQKDIKTILSKGKY